MLHSVVLSERVVVLIFLNLLDSVSKYSVACFITGARLKI